MCPQDLKKRSKIVTTNAEIAQVGTISANGDKKIGNQIGGCFVRTRRGRDAGRD